MRAVQPSGMIILSVSLLLLSACGGGGGGGGGAIVKKPQNSGLDWVVDTIGGQSFRCGVASNDRLGAERPTPQSLSSLDRGQCASTGLWAINVQAAWATGRRGQDVTVAVIDDGVDDQHPDLTNNIRRDSNRKVIGLKLRL